MCIIMKEMSLYWIIGLLALWTGVITAGNVTAAPGVATTTSNEISAFIISIKITNRIYNNSLEDQQSQNYKILRQEVENVFHEMYSSTPSAQYQEIAEMTFSNGSVIANSTVLFGTKQKSGQTVKNIFVTNYEQHPSLNLALNISYTADQEPILVPLSILQGIPYSVSSLTTSITSPDSHIITELPGHIQSTTVTASASTTSGPDESLDNNNATSATPQTHSTTNASNIDHSTVTTSNITSNSSSVTEHSSTITSPMSAANLPTMAAHPSSNISTLSASSPLNTTVHPTSNMSTLSASSPLNTTVHPTSNISTLSASSPLNTTEHLSSNITTISGSSPLNTTVHPINNISPMSSSNSSTTATHPSSNISTMSPSSSSTTTVHPSSKISAMPASSSSDNPGKTVTQKPTGTEGSDTVVTEQGVPGWGIAILVLAAIILFFMLILIILLLLFWCCWWRQRGFMSVSDPDPTGYYNPDIPMYSTHSTYESHNGKSLISP